MVKKRGLGKSLNALLAYKETEAPKESINESNPNARELLRQLGVEELQRGEYQPRRKMDRESLEELASSIRNQGIIQPLIVRPVGSRYEIIAGERRWRAAQMAGLTEVPVIIRDIPDKAAIAIALIENIQRENLNPIEESTALQRLIDEFGMTHQQVSEAVGKSRTTVTNLLRLLSLPEKIKSLLQNGQIEMGHARTLITLSEPLQLQAADIIVARGLSVRETETLVKRMQSGQPTPPSRKPIDPDVKKLQEGLSRQLKMRVAIQYNAKGKGKLVVHYRNLRELDELLEHFQPEMTGSN